MDQAHIEGDNLVYFCKNTKTFQYDSSESTEEIFLKKELREYSLDELKDIIKDLVNKYIK